MWEAVGIVGEYFVADQGSAAPDAEVRHSADFVGRQDGTGGIVRTHDDDRLRPRRDNTLQLVGVETPTTVEIQLIRRSSNALRVRQMFEKRVRRRRNENVIASIAQQLEEQRVAFARARRQYHAVRVDRCTSRGIILRDRAASADPAAWVRFVPNGIRRRQQFGHAMRIHREPGARRIRLGQVDQRTAPAREFERSGNRVRRQIGRYA